MTGQLVFVHGRSQEYRDSASLKGAWIAALKEGLAKSGLDLPIPETSVRFPYYGQTLFDLVSDAAHVAEVIVRGPGTDDAERQFNRAVLQEVQEVRGIPDDEVEAVLGTEVVERGVLNWEWVQGILKVLDQHLPGGSAATVALATHDVYQYLRNPGIRDAIERGVRAAFTRRMPTVVVSHSLGTVVAFNLLRREGDVERWSVPLLVTLGSPLAITAIKTSLSPIEHPSCVRKWYNARDERDVVALYPLDKAHFDIDPAIENSAAVQNHTDNRHGISGYLDDKDVARRIYDALVAA
jgi:hypothetical protein